MLISRLLIGINRNIVECKVVTLLSIFYHRSVLIETLWNVKFLRSDTMSITNVGINRNIVECKDNKKRSC